VKKFHGRKAKTVPNNLADSLYILKRKPNLLFLIWQKNKMVVVVAVEIDSSCFETVTTNGMKTGSTKLSITGQSCSSVLLISIWWHFVSFVKIPTR